MCCAVCTQTDRSCCSSYLVSSLMSSAACGNESCWHSELQPLRQARRHKNTRKCVYSVPPTRSLPILLPLIYSIFISPWPSPPLRLFIFYSDLIFGVWFSLSCRRTVRSWGCHSRQWEQWASLLFSSPPVHSAPRWLKWGYTGMLIWKWQRHFQPRTLTYLFQTSPANLHDLKR